MQEEEIEQSFSEILALHHTLGEENPLTYAIFLAENADRLSPEQKEFLKARARIAAEKQSRISKLIMDKMDNEISRMSVIEKVGEAENYCVQLEERKADE